MKMRQKTPSMQMMRKNSARAAALLRELANPHRLRMLCALVEGERTVGELLKTVDLSQSALSQHLARLRESGLVACEKRGLHVAYRIASMEAQAVLSTLYFMYCKH